MANLCTSLPFGFHISWYLWYQTFTASKKSYHCQGWLYSRFPLSHACPCSPLTMSVPAFLPGLQWKKQLSFAFCSCSMEWWVEKEMTLKVTRNIWTYYSEHCLPYIFVAGLSCHWIYGQGRWLKAQSVFAVKILFSLYVLKKKKQSLIERGKNTSRSEWKNALRGQSSVLNVELTVVSGLYLLKYILT